MTPSPTTKWISFYQLLFASIVLAVLCPVVLLGQPADNNHFEGSRVATPEAAVFQKFLEIPVSHFTGASSTSIPIHTLRQGRLSLPIGLAYNNSGIKVAEVAGWVGLGWSLNYGGMINRTIRGLEDDRPNVGYIDRAISLTGTDRSELDQVGPGNNGDWDSEPDLFSYSAGGYSGKFFFDGSSRTEVVQINQQDVRIVPQWSANNSVLLGFSVIIPNGTRYIFNVGSSTQNLTVAATIHGYSSWRLRRIESYDGHDVIDFHYTTETYDYQVPSGAYMSYGSLSDQGSVSDEDDFVLPRYNDPTDAGYYRIQVNGQRLTRITSGTTTIDFEPSAAPREDIGFQSSGNAYALAAIEISVGSEDRFKKRFDLTHSYFAAAGNLSFQNLRSNRELRLKLESVQEFSATAPTLSLPAHEFTYYGDQQLNGYQFLPDRFSKRIDHWGYYNNADENDGLVLLCPANVGAGPYSDYCRANRESDADAMKIGSLIRHRFPTGGYRDYELEANTIYGEKTYCSITPLGIKNSTCRTTAIDGTNCCGALPASRTEIYDAEMETADMVRIYLEKPVDDNGTPVCGNNISYQFEIKDANGNSIAGFPTVSENFTQADLPYTGTLNLSEEFPNLLLGTSYQFHFTVYNTAGEATLYRKTVNTVTENYPVGGLRTKQITLTDPVAGATVEKSFAYTALNGLASSARLVAVPQYFYSLQNGQPGDLSGNGSNPFVFDNSYYKDNSQTQLFDLDGYHLAYGEVSEEAPGSNGLTHYEFYNTVPQPQTYGFPRGPSQLDQLRGRPIAVTHYKEGQPTAGNVVSRTEYDYDINLSASTGTMYSLFWMLAPLNMCTNNNPIYGFRCPVRIVYGYNIQYGHVDLVGESVTTDGVTVNRTYTHDSPGGYRYRTSETVHDGSGTAYTTDYQYPEHFSGPAYQEMAGRNILQPLRTEKIANGITVDGTRTEWELFDGVPYPTRIERLERTETNGSWSGGWELQAEILAYDANGRPSKYRRDGWGLEQYHWSDHGFLEERNYTPPGATQPGMRWQYDYYPDSYYLREMTDADGQKISYTYDDFCRLKTTTARDGKLVTNNSYYYNAGANASLPNEVRSTVTFTPTTGSQLTQQTTRGYLDGLGRPLQTVRQQYDSDQEDVVTGATAYDNLGRPYRAYETFGSGHTDGRYVIPSGAEGYQELTYEPSPLSRPLSTTHFPDWNYPTLTEYSSNAATITLPDGTTYAPDSLRTEALIDGNGNSTVNYLDKLGRGVLSERYTGTPTAGTLTTRTFTQFDYKNRVTAVFPPGSATAAQNAERIYVYRYDGADNMIYKKIPEQGATTYVYDDRNLPVFTQSPSVPDAYDYFVTVYDGYGRMTAEGLGSGSIPTSPLTTIPAADQLMTAAYGTTGIELTRVVSSSKRILEDGALTGVLTFTNEYDEHGRLKSEQGNHHLDLTDATAMVTTYTYDYADNLLKSNYHHTFGGEDLRTISETTIDHSGRPVAEYHQVIRNGKTGPRTQTSATTYTAKDQVDQTRLGKTTTGFLQTVDYDYLTNGFLTGINNPASLGDDLFALAIGYNAAAANSNGVAQYNGNISSLVSRTASGTHHAFGYTYDGLDRLTSTDYYDYQDAAADNRYSTTYTYDALGNITTLTRGGVRIDGENTSSGRIDDLTYQYDTANGRPNRLLSVTDAAPATLRQEGYNPQTPNNYAYNEAGSMTYNPAGDYTVAYNHLELPHTFTLPGQKGSIRYVYAADGTKLSERTVSLTGDQISRRDYLGPVEYVDQIIEFVAHANGRAVPAPCVSVVHHDATVTDQQNITAGVITSTATVNSGGDLTYTGGQSVELQAGFEVEAGGVFTAEVSPCDGTGEEWNYEYFLADHLGSNRVQFSDLDGDGVVASTEVLREEHFYAFGMSMKGDWRKDLMTNNRYRYNGKELNGELGLYDYGARYYDPAIGRWLQIDPLADMYDSWSPYNYVLNNPVINTDPDGRSVNNEYVVDKSTGETLQVGTVGGDEIDFVYSGTINEDGSVTIDDTNPEVVEVETDYVAAGSYGGTVSRSLGKHTVSIGPAQGRLQTMDGGDDPFFNLLTLGTASRLSRADDVVDGTLGFAKHSRKRSSTLRRLWEKFTGKKWPKEPKTINGKPNPHHGKNQSVAHKQALRDGGSNEMSNIKPEPWVIH